MIEPRRQPRVFGRPVPRFTIRGMMLLVLVSGLVMGAVKLVDPAVAILILIAAPFLSPAVLAIWVIADNLISAIADRLQSRRDHLP